MPAPSATPPRRASSSSRLRRLAGIGLVSLALTSCHQGATTALPRCTPAPPGIGPDATATLQAENDGATVCLGRGDVLTVFLRAAPAGAGPSWSPVRDSDTGVLAPRSTGVMTLPRGVTGAIFQARATGLATLRSDRGGRRWSARVVVRR